MLIGRVGLIKLELLRICPKGHLSISSYLTTNTDSTIIICIFFGCWPFCYFISIPIKRLRASFVSILVYDWLLIEDVLFRVLFTHIMLWRPFRFHVSIANRCFFVCLCLALNENALKINWKDNDIPTKLNLCSLQKIVSFIIFRCSSH